jgi:hypothetical protein
MLGTNGFQFPVWRAGGPGIEGRPPVQIDNCDAMGYRRIALR